MTIQSMRQLGNTRKKLQMLEYRLGELDAEPVANPRPGIGRVLAQEADQPAQGRGRAIRVPRAGPVAWDLKTPSVRFVPLWDARTYRG